MKVKIIRRNDIDSLQKDINDYIKVFGSDNIKDIKYISCMAGTSHNIYTEYSAMIIIK